MKAKFYLKREDALKAAKKFAEENDGWINNQMAIMDDRCEFDYMDDASQRLMWSGSVSAFSVWLGGTDFSYFAFWE